MVDIDAKFFETYGPLEEFYVNDKLDNSSSLRCLPITMFCDKCNMERTFNQYLSTSLIDGNIYKVAYMCTACKDFKIIFIIYLDIKINSIKKLTQWPLWLPKIDADLKKSLGKNHGNYKKGLYCEQEGYGIGAFAYYRRIVEDMIDGLLDDIYEMFSEEEKQTYKENIELAKKERVTEKKIEIVKKILPSELISNGINPLDRLHSGLSEGLHSMPDEGCLKTATAVRISLEYLLHEIVLRKKRKIEYASAMKELEKQTTKKHK